MGRDKVQFHRNLVETILSPLLNRLWFDQIGASTIKCRSRKTLGSNTQSPHSGWRTFTKLSTNFTKIVTNSDRKKYLPFYLFDIKQEMVKTSTFFLHHSFCSCHINSSQWQLRVIVVCSLPQLPTYADILYLIRYVLCVEKTIKKVHFRRQTNNLYEENMIIPNYTKSLLVNEFSTNKCLVSNVMFLHKL